MTHQKAGESCIGQRATEQQLSGSDMQTVALGTALARLPHQHGCANMWPPATNRKAPQLGKNIFIPAKWSNKGKNVGKLSGMTKQP